MTKTRIFIYGFTLGLCLLMLVFKYNEINNRANSKIIFKLNEGENFKFQVVMPPGKYRVSCVSDRPELSTAFGRAVEGKGVFVSIKQKDKTILDCEILQGVDFGIGSFKEGVVDVEIRRSDQGDPLFVLFGRPL